MNIYEKLFQVMGETEKLEKDMTIGSGGNAYKAVSEKQILNMMKPLFKKYKLLIFPIDGEINDYVDKYDKATSTGTAQTLRAITQLKVSFRIYDTETGEHQDVVGFGNGADSQDKGAGKAFTYSLKNALCKTFMLFSGEDTDNEHSDDIDARQVQVIPTYSKTETVKPTTPADSPVKSRVISVLQAKRIFGIAKNNKPKLSDDDLETVKIILAKYGYTDSRAVEWKDYEKICKEIEGISKMSVDDKKFNAELKDQTELPF